MKISVNCSNCGASLMKTKSQMRGTKHTYCNSKCFATHTNTIRPKESYKQKTKKCEKCNEKIFSNRKYCKSCYKNKLEDCTKTLGEAIYKEHHLSSAYALVRSRARAIAKKEGWAKCSKCGYDKHIEIAHIKPIGSFSHDTLISEINDPLTNLLPLCPNCHWEFDNLNN